MKKSRRKLCIPKYNTGSDQYYTTYKDGARFNINPNVVDANDLIVTTPEIEVTAAKPAWMTIPRNDYLREGGAQSSDVDRFVDKWLSSKNPIMSGIARATQDWRTDKSPIRAAMRNFGWWNPLISLTSAGLDHRLGTKSNAPQLMIPQMIQDYGNKYSAALQSLYNLTSDNGLKKTKRYFDELYQSNPFEGDYAGKFWNTVGSGIGDVFDATLLKHGASTALKPLGALVEDAKSDLNQRIFTHDIKKSNGQVPARAWKKGVKDYKDLINSENYAGRIRRAGLSDDHLQYMKEFTDWSLEGAPRRVVDVIENDPDIEGLSEADRRKPLYGITLKKGLPLKDFMSTLLHEIAHFATRNRGLNSKTPIGDIMRANEDIAENIPWEQKLWEYPENTPVERIEKDLETYEYLVDPQEKRSRAVQIYQYAKNAKMSTDDYIDKFIESNKAPVALKQMRYIMSPDNLKKYVRNFMGIATPIGVVSNINRK